MTERTTLTTKTGVLDGTLLIPAAASRPMPVALLIAGSGPTDRDGNSPLLPGKNNSLAMLADALGQHGIATLRYDKRGIGASASAMGQESDLRFTTYGSRARRPRDDRHPGEQRRRRPTRERTLARHDRDHRGDESRAQGGPRIEPADRLVLGPRASAASSARRVHREFHRSMTARTELAKSKSKT